MSLEPGPLPAEEFRSLIAGQSESFGVAPAPERLSALSRFLAELDSWRRRTNLTGALSAGDLAGHALESALGGPLVAENARALDIGSGAGFPGIPITILRPDISMVLLEPRAKRAEFLKHVIRVVPVANAQALQKRLETAGFGPQTFDCALVRAVGDLPRVIGEAAFLRSGGALLAWTTSPEQLRRGLPAFTLSRVLAVPGSRRKVIAELVRSA